MSEIERFIRKRFKNDNWMTGNCYYLSLILSDRFPGGSIIFDKENYHFLYKVNNKCYDFEGQHNLPEKFDYLEDLKGTKLYDKLIYKEIIM